MGLTDTTITAAPLKVTIEESCNLAGIKRGSKHTPENIVDIDKNVASANTDAFKRAVNRLCNVCDDIYRKQILEPLSESDKDRLASTLDAADDKLRRAINVKIARGEIHSRKLDDWIKLIEDKLKESK